jgi:hypothetical protein
MTADEWETSNDAIEMLRAVRGRWRNQDALRRRLTRYYIACARALSPLIPQDASRRAIEVKERHLDGSATDDELSRAEWNAEAAAFFLDYNCDPEVIEQWGRAVDALPPAVLAEIIHTDDARVLRSRTLLARAAYFVDSVVCYPYCNLKRPSPEHAPVLSAPLLRCVFANPLRPVTFEARWRTADVMGLARGIYEEREFDRLPLLGDALMDAGCQDEQVLGHCQSEGRVRGCWVVDLVLRKD